MVIDFSRSSETCFAQEPSVRPSEPGRGASSARLRIKSHSNRCVVFFSSPICAFLISDSIDNHHFSRAASKKGRKKPALANVVEPPVRISASDDLSACAGVYSPSASSGLRPESS